MKFFIRMFNTVCDWMFNDLCEKVKNNEIDGSIIPTICNAH
jgi:hypothetical protein